MSIDYTQGAGSVAKQIVNDEYAKSVRERAKLLSETTGFELKECERFVKKEDYKRQYNERADVQAKRKAYNQKRAAEMKAMRQLIAADPELLKKVQGR